MNQIIKTNHTLPLNNAGDTYNPCCTCLSPFKHVNWWEYFMLPSFHQDGFMQLRYIQHQRPILHDCPSCCVKDGTESFAGLCRFMSQFTLPKTNSSPLKISLLKSNVVSQAPFSGAMYGYVSFGEVIHQKKLQLFDKC